MGAFVAPIVAGLGAITGLFGGNKSTSNSTTTTTPNFTPAQQQLIASLMQGYQGSISGLPAWNKAYETTGTQNILRGSVQSAQAAQDALAARGISRTTAGAQAINDQSQNEGLNLSNFLNNAPIVEQQNLLNTLGGASGFEASLPVGSTSSSNTTATGNAPVSPVAGFLGGGATTLAGLLGQQSASANLAKVLKAAGISSGIPANTAVPGSTSVQGDTGGWSD